MSFGVPSPRRKSKWRFALAATFTAALVATTTASATSVATADELEPQAESDTLIHDRIDELLRKIYVRTTMSQMTLEEKVGQLFMPRVYGNTADTTDPDDIARNQDLHGVDNGVELMETYNVGGLIYFAWADNVDDPHQTAGLSNGLQEAAMDNGSGVPLLISTDQEHGTVARVTEPATQLPGAMALGSTWDDALAHDAADIAGMELRALGISQNFAPVADVNVNPENPVIGIRSFSSDPQLASDMTAAQVNGYQSGDLDVAAAAKHFPGHGNTDLDSHHDLPVIPHTYEEWQEIDAPPFEAAIENDIDVIMTAHIQFPALDDSGKPATLSEPIMSDVLRGDMGYEGVVVTDSLGMAGVREDFDDDEIPVLALQAGVDLLLNAPDTEVAYDAVIDAVADGELTESRIDESVERLLSLKHQRGVVQDPLVDVDSVDDVVGIDEHLDTASDISDATTTLVQNHEDTLPLPADTGQSTLVTGNGEEAIPAIADELTDRGLEATELHTGLEPDEEDIAAAGSAAADSDLVVVTTTSVDADSEQLELVEALQDSGTTVVVLATGTPYDIAHFPDVDAYVAAYGDTGFALDSAVKVLFDEVSPTGKLPVMIPQADDPDSALFELGHGMSY